MNGIIKTIKTTQYAQIHNAPLQTELEDLRAIGLLSHIMSLGEGWTIRKTQLQKKFSRRNVDAAWKELAEKQYAVGFSAYVDGKKDYFYAVSDIPITQDDFELLVIEQIKHLQSEDKNVMTLAIIQHSPLEITDKMSDVQNVQQKQKSQNSSDVQYVQHNLYSTDRTLINKKEINEKEINEKINNNNNSRDLIDNELRKEFPDIPFDEVKQALIDDGKFDITTDKQYKGSLEYCLTNWKPKQSSKPKKTRTTRKEMVPTWLNTAQRETSATIETEQSNNDFEIEKRKLEAEMKQLQHDLKAGKL